MKRITVIIPIIIIIVVILGASRFLTYDFKSWTLSEFSAVVYKQGNTTTTTGTTTSSSWMSSMTKGISTEIKKYKITSKDDDNNFIMPSLLDNDTVNVNYVNNSELKSMCSDFFSGGTCKNIMGNYTSRIEYNNHSTLINITFGCDDLFKHGGLGSGNYMSAFYHIRMIAQALGNKTDVIIQCPDANETKDRLILPWLMGMFPRRRLSTAALQESNNKDDIPSVDEACASYVTTPIGYQWREMRYDMRRMAIALVGIPSPDHPSAAWAEENLWSSETPQHITRYNGNVNYMQIPHPKKDDIPIYPNVTLDDAMIHFRCGDIAMSNHPSFGFMPYSSYARHLSKEVKSIGIATQPWGGTAHSRGEDTGGHKARRCKDLVMGLVKYLNERFPNVPVRIHNGVDETITLTFARMIMANQTVIGVTSFGVFPGVTTFGTGYIRKPDFRKAPNRWLLTSPLVERVDNVKLIEEPFLGCGPFKGKWNDGTAMDWFRNATSL